jgi:hypothetical protein
MLSTPYSHLPPILPFAPAWCMAMIEIEIVYNMYEVKAVALFGPS